MISAIALRVLGERESGTARLDEAVETPIARPCWNTPAIACRCDWAMTQNNLGNALGTLGERESGTARLDEAVEAYRAALLERTRERVPLDWATTQNNLGVRSECLASARPARRASKRRSRPFARPCWNEPASACRCDWAMTQNNLGNALAALGQREGGTARLKEAVEAFRAALQERHPRTRAARLGYDPEQSRHSRSQCLASARAAQTRFDEAIEAFRAALQEYNPRAGAVLARQNAAET